jgi:DNA adenine methylase
MANPIIKWAGGKNKIISQFEKIYHYIYDKKTNFFDLFCGSLSITFATGKHKQKIVNDINTGLINMYKIVKENCEELLIELEKFNHPDYNNVEKFNEVRAKFNLVKNSKKISSPIEFAAMFIYLNKRSFNGLYRENKRGLYNVPYRRYNCDIYKKNDIIMLSRYFNDNNFIFENKDFRDFNLDIFNKGDIVYLDPPYYDTQFTQYWKTGFGEKDQYDLFLFCCKLDQKGVNLIISNSPCTEIIKMYQKFNQKTFHIGRQMRDAILGSKIENKQKDNEILIWNFALLEFEIEN